MENKKLLDWFLLFSAICVVLLAILLYNIVFGDSCQAQSCGAETMPTVVANQEEIWTTDHELIKLLEEAEITPETIKNNNIETLHAKICKTTSKSPLCEDIEILRRIDSIAKEKWVPTGLIIGIMHAESSLSTNYNKPICKTRNNPYWIKGVSSTTERLWCIIMVEVGIAMDATCIRLHLSMKLLTHSLTVSL